MALSLNANELVRLIKTIATDAVNASAPFAMKIGDVVSADPLKISINQKITIPAAQLMLTNAVRDHTASITDGNGDEAVVTVHNALHAGERVLLLRCDGGQKFIVLDRLEAP